MSISLLLARFTASHSASTLLLVSGYTLWMLVLRFATVIAIQYYHIINTIIIIRLGIYRRAEWMKRKEKKENHETRDAVFIPFSATFHQISLAHCHGSFSFYFWEKLFSVSFLCFRVAKCYS